MALKKKQVIKNIEAEYWRVVGYTISLSGELAQIFLVGYIDQVGREARRDVVSTNYMITKEVFSKYIKLVDGVHTSDLYGFLKSEIEAFKEAEDV